MAGDAHLVGDTDIVAYLSGNRRLDDRGLDEGGHHYFSAYHVTVLVPDRSRTVR